MDFWTGAVWLPLIGATLHPVLGWAIQRATRCGVSLVLLAGLNNILTVVVVLAYKRPDGGWSLSALDWLAIANGVLFFFGQWFSILSVRRGHLAVHSSVLGVKILIVAALSIGFGLESGRLSLLGAVVLASLAIFLVAGATPKGWKDHRVTVGLTVVACIFFGVNDFLTGSYGSTVGTTRWITLMMGSSGLMSLILVASRGKQFRDLITGGNGKWFVLVAGLCLGVQSLLVNIAFSDYGQPTLSNVVYSIRGIIAVGWLLLFGGVAGKEHWGRRSIGSLIMLAALWLALSG